MPPVEPKDDSSPRANVVRALTEGLLLTVAQVVFACLVGTYANGSVSPAPDDLLNSYYKLVGAEGYWHLRIAEDGYQADKEYVPGKRGNVAFFPAYVCLVRGVHHLTGGPWPLCLLFVSQIACWGFWTYFFLLLDRHNVPDGQSRLAAIFLAAQPSSFFLVAGCSDSLFLFSVLGFIYWTDSERPVFEWLGVLHGILMTATSIVGLPLVLYPMIRGYLRTGDEHGLEKALGGMVLGVVSSLGGLAFFAYCQQTFGAWDIVPKTQDLFWHIRPNVLALLDADTYVLDLELWMVDGFLSSDWLGRILVPAFLILFAILFMIETYVATVLPNGSVRDRIGYFLLAFVFFLTITAELFGSQYRSMIRAVFLCETLIVLEVAHMFNNEDIEGADWGTYLFVGILAVPAIVVQAVFLHRYMNGMWVA